MSKIKISDLRPTGSELFSDSESFMNDLVDGEIGTIQGGFSSWGCVAVSVLVVSIVVTTAQPAE